MIAELKALEADAPERILALPILLRLRLAIPSDPSATSMSEPNGNASNEPGAPMGDAERARAWFVIAKNPDAASSLPYLVRLPIGGGMILKVRDTWPKTARVYCHPHPGPWPDDAEIVEETPIVLCNRRGPAIDLVLDRPRQDRSQFVFTESRGRSMIFWQTRTVAMKANPGGRVPQRRALSTGFTIHVDTREKYAFKFAGRDVTIEHTAVDAGDYGVRAGERWLAVVERKSVEDLLSSLSNGTLVYQLAAMAELPLAAVVVEGRYPKLFEAPRVKEGWLPDVLARLQIRYREIPIVFADSRKFAEEWTYRFLATAMADLSEAASAGDAAWPPNQHE